MSEVIKPGDKIRVDAPYLEAYHGKDFIVEWVGTYAANPARNPIAHFYVKPDETNIERKRGSFVFAGEYEKVDKPCLSP